MRFIRTTVVAAVAVIATTAFAGSATAASPQANKSAASAHGHLVTAFDHDLQTGSASFSSADACDQDLGAGSPSRTSDDPSAVLVPACDTDLPTGSIKVTSSDIALLTTNGVIPNTASWVCTVYASDPWENLGRIYGDSANFCSGAGYQPIYLHQAILQYRGFGIWATKASRTTDAYYHSYLDYTGYWTCAKGTGNQLYRVVTTGYAEGTNFQKSVQSENYLRVTCPL